MSKIVILLLLSACCTHSNIELKEYSTKFMDKFQTEIELKGCYSCIAMHREYKYLRSQIKQCKEGIE